MTFSTAFFTLLLVMDPIGNVPVFISLLKSFEPARRQKIILRECLFAFLILTFFLFAGKNVLTGMGISEAALGITGGIILFLISIKMMFDEHSEKREIPTHEPFIVPLAIPLVAGPSSIATIILIADRHPQHWGVWLGALASAAVVSTIILFFSTQLIRLLGQRLIYALERLMGMLLATLSVQMLLSGIQSYFHLNSL